ncbi:unnamed protein product, partial [Scytosiphon promiscuus]
MLLVLTGINSGVNNPPQAGPAGLDLAAIAPTLQAFGTELFTLYTTNLTTELLLIEFPLSAVTGEEGAPRKKVIFGASYAKGSYDDHTSVALLHYPAESTEETVFSFQLTEDMGGVDVLREQLTLRTSDEGMATSLANSAPPEWITTLPVLEAGPESVMISAENLLINGFYVTDIEPTKLANMRLKLSETRAYPKNAGLTVEYQLVADPGGEPGDVIPISIRFSISALPCEPMQPRWGDKRVGFFNSVYTDLGDHRASREGRNTDLFDTKVTLINRRRIAVPTASSEDGGASDGQAGEAGEMEEAEDAEAGPLTYYIDPSVPPQWREYMRSGVEAWRPAFEAAGLGGEAIRAVLPDDEDWPEDYDAGDIRFNSITWAVDVDQVFALGPATIDPRTGEILHSGIVFTDGWIKNCADDGRGDRDDVTTAVALLLSREAHSKGEDGGGDWCKDGGVGVLEKLLPQPRAASFFLRNSRRSSHTHSLTASCDISMSLLPLMQREEGRGGRERYPSRGGSSRKLDEGEGEAGESGRGTAPGLATDEILGAGLVDVVMHEVGHTLGLRHNFAGSTMLTLEELQDPTKTADVGLTSSVMDYLPLNIVSSKMQGSEVPHYFTPRIGEYDMWAIKYGYMAVEGEGEDNLAEHEDLKAVAAEALAFATDEDGPDSSGMNPLASVFDLGKEPMDYWEDRLELVTELWPVLLDRSTEGGAEFQRYGSAATSLLRQVMLSGLYSTKYLGGFDISKQRRIDDTTPGPIQLIPAERQRRALTLILRIVAGDDSAGAAAFLPAEEDFSNLAAWSGVCEGPEQYCYGVVPVDPLSE